MRDDADDGDVDGQSHGGVAQVARLARVDVDVLVPEGNPADELLNRLLGQVDRQRAAVALDLPARVVVHLDDDVLALLDRTTVAVGKKAGLSSRRPAAHAARGNEVRPAERRVAVAAGLLLESARRAALVEVDERVVHDRRRARTEVGRDDVAVLGDLKVEDERPVNVRAARRDLEVLGHAEDDVRLAQGPLGREDGRGRSLGRIALGRARLGPGRQDLDLVVGQPSLVGEVAVVGSRVPRRHVARLGHRGDRARALGRVLEGHERERRDRSGVVAAGAVGLEDRRDLSRVGDRLGCAGDGPRLERAAHRRRAVGEWSEARGDGRDRVLEVVVAHLRLRLAQLEKRVVDPPAVEQLAVAAEDERLGRVSRRESPREVARRVEDHGEADLILLRVLDRLAPGKRGIRQDAEDLEVVVPAGARERVERRDRAVGDRAIGREEDDGRRARPATRADGVHVPLEVESAERDQRARDHRGDAGAGLLPARLLPAPRSGRQGQGGETDGDGRTAQGKPRAAR